MLYSESLQFAFDFDIWTEAKNSFTEKSIQVINGKHPSVYIKKSFNWYLETSCSSFLSKLLMELILIYLTTLSLMVVSIKMFITDPVIFKRPRS